MSEEIPKSIYHRIFEQDSDGRKVLGQLNGLYNSRSSYNGKCDALAMAFKEGQRSVVIFLNNKVKPEGDK